MPRSVHSSPTAMAYMHFSWSDSFHAALSSCLPCLKSDAPSDTEEHSPAPGRGFNPALAHGIIPPPRARPDELEGLLADASDDAETLSLHSNIGSDRRRKGKGKGKHKKRRGGPPKHIRVFGYDLFGRAPAIQLPESDDEAALVGAGGEQRARTISTDTLDSDAAPLDAAAIEELSAARHAEALAREEEERRAKEERRRRRREKRELKRAAMAAALEQQANGNEEFEGFQGSGPAFGLTGPFSPSLGSGSGSMSFSDSQEFGPFAHGQVTHAFDPDAALAAQDAAEAEADGADFGGESYTHRPRKSKSASGRTGSGTQTTSDTRSSSTGTGSNSQYRQQYAAVAPYNHQFLAQQQQQAAPRSPLSPLSPGVEGGAPPSPGGASASNGAKKRRRKSTRPKSHTVSASISGSSASASQSASLVSPTASDVPLAGAPRVALPGRVHSHSMSLAGEDFEGFPGDLGVQELQMGAQSFVAGPEDAKKDGQLPTAAFPSVGLRGVQRTKSDMGVFLARRGDE
ncbi:hypothetical protein C8Q77DRAFT_647020 [Trametes polyzona]|nr:hypothetical protein C8Q77DRAFT_647020 [Trametes polyzona]